MILRVNREKKVRGSKQTAKEELLFLLWKNITEDETANGGYKQRLSRFVEKEREYWVRFINSSGGGKVRTASLNEGVWGP